MKCEYCQMDNYDGERKCEGCGAPLPDPKSELVYWASTDPGVVQDASSNWED